MSSAPRIATGTVSSTATGSVHSELRCEQQEDDDQPGDEGDRRGAARGLFLQSLAGPGVRSLRQRLRRHLLHRRERLARAVASAGLPVILTAWKPLKRSIGRGAPYPRADEPRQRHHLAVCERTNTRSKSCGSMRYFASACSTTHQTRLDWLNWPTTCEAKNDCMVWNASCTDTPSTSALDRSRSTSNCCVEPRKVVRTPASSGRGRGLDHRLHRLLGGAHAAGTAVLHVELESAGSAQARNRRRVHGKGKAFGQPGELAVDARQRGEGQQRRVLALVEGLHRDEEHRRVVADAAVGEAVAIDRGHVAHRRVGTHDVHGLAHHSATTPWLAVSGASRMTKKQPWSSSGTKLPGSVRNSRKMPTAIAANTPSVTGDACTARATPPT